MAHSILNCEVSETAIVHDPLVSGLESKNIRESRTPSVRESSTSSVRESSSLDPELLILRL